MATVVVATGNPEKLKEMQAYLKDLDWSLTLKPSHLEIEETGQTFLENARLKASGVARALGQWAIADDSGLQVDALNGAPGIYSARYADSDGARVERLLSAMVGISDRRGQFVCALALARPDGTIALETEGICGGVILTEPRGQGGFGYDPVFYVEKVGQTFAEMSALEKHHHSHRGLAFRQLWPALASLRP
ncbi:MAG: RdgB/HAM1 family non-canonical purine NTP pyrophosphatase [Nodosilinea sp.]